MNVAKHTPGPWKLTEGECFYVNANVDGQRIFILQRAKAKVARSNSYVEADQDRIYADCKLIAAAPELLAALQEAIAWIPCGPESWHTDSPRKAIEAARFAIAKATGEQA